MNAKEWEKSNSLLCEQTVVLEPIAVRNISRSKSNKVELFSVSPTIYTYFCWCPVFSFIHCFSLLLLSSSDWFVCARSLITLAKRVTTHRSDRPGRASAIHNIILYAEYFQFTHTNTHIAVIIVLFNTNNESSYTIATNMIMTIINI